LADATVTRRLGGVGVDDVSADPVPVSVDPVPPDTLPFPPKPETPKTLPPDAASIPPNPVPFASEVLVKAPKMEVDEAVVPNAFPVLGRFPKMLVEVLLREDAPNMIAGEVVNVFEVE